MVNATETALRLIIALKISDVIKLHTVERTGLWLKNHGRAMPIKSSVLGLSQRLVMLNLMFLFHSQVHLPATGLDPQTCEPQHRR